MSERVRRRITAKYAMAASVPIGNAMNPTQMLVAHPPRRSSIAVTNPQIGMTATTTNIPTMNSPSGNVTLRRLDRCTCAQRHDSEVPNLADTRGASESPPH